MLNWLPVTIALKADLQTQLVKILDSPSFKGSEVLCKLLQYLTQHASEQPGIPIKEFQIATEALGRSGDFDPRIDSAVRVLTSRLRTKLTEYYSTVGMDDSLILAIPKGSYVLQVERRTPATPPARSPAKAFPDVGVSSSQDGNAKPVSLGRTPRSYSGRFLLACTLAVAVAATALATLVERTRVTSALAPQSRVTESPNAANKELRQFWSVFLASPTDPWVIFSNAQFIGRPATGLRYFRPGIDPPNHGWGLYTGVGEVLATHSLDVAFSGFHRSLRVKRVQLLTLDDAKNYDLIFLGAPVENPVLNDLPGLQEFTFEPSSKPALLGDMAIRNRHPRANEQPLYLRSSDAPLVDDYFIVALLKGFDSTHWILLLSGSSSLGTQAAADFVCNEREVAKLSEALGPGAFTRPFEAVFHTKISQGVPMTSELVTYRLR